MSQFHEWSCPIWVQTPLGPGRWLLLQEPSTDWNGIALVQLDDGRFRYVDVAELRAFENWTYGIAKPDAPR